MSKEEQKRERADIRAKIVAILRNTEFGREMTNTQIRQAYLNLFPRKYSIDGSFTAYNKPPNARELRRLIHEIRINNELPLLLANGRGYFVASNSADVVEYLDKSNKHIEELMSLNSAIIKQMQESGLVPSMSGGI